MDGVAIALQAPEETEGEDADHEADEGHHDADASDDGQEQLVHFTAGLKRKGEMTKRGVWSSEGNNGSLPF